MKKSTANLLGEMIKEAAKTATVINFEEWCKEVEAEEAKKKESEGKEEKDNG